MIHSGRRTRLSLRLVCATALAWAVGCTAPHAPATGAASASAPQQRAGEEPLEIALWRAGRAIPPGLSAARQSELVAERARAVQRLDERWRPSMEVRLAAWLEDPATPDELWCAAARAVAWLERYHLTPALAPALEPGAPPRRAVAARRALHQLYGRWFRSAEELQPYLASVRGGAGTRLLLGALREEERRSRDHLQRRLDLKPSEAVSWLQDPDPEIRSVAARKLAGASRGEGGEPDAALDVLVTHLESENEPRAFHEVMQACLARLERTSPDDPTSARLRALMVEIARTPGDPRTLTVAQALPRLSWRMDGARDLGHLLSGVEFLGSMLRGLAAAERARGASDPDPLVAVLVAMRQMCEEGKAGGLGRELRDSVARDNLYTVLGDPQQDVAVRAAAAAALGPLSRAGDGPRLAAVLTDPGIGAAVKHALLGSLAGILATQEPGAQGIDELLQAVAELTGDADADLRRRALALFARPELEPLVAGLDPNFLVERLATEDRTAASLEILGLIQRFGRPEMLAPILALERVEALCADPVTLDALVAVCARLKGPSAGATMAAASRIASARSEATSLARMRHALALVASLDVPGALELSSREHAAVVTWVGRVVTAGVAPRDLVPSGAAFEERLLDVHVPRAERELAGAPAFEHAHLVALLRADLFLAGTTGSTRTSKAQVEAAFETAQALAPRPSARLLVLRDRARFRAAASEAVKALSDYRRLFEVGPDADDLLGIPDLRTAVELLHRLTEVGGGGGPASAAEAADLLERLVAKDGWRAEPASVRMQDIRDWVKASLEARDLLRLQRLERRLADLPLTQVEARTDAQPAPLWAGLTREGDWFQELLDLRARLRIGLRELEAQG